ncbi:hypothetical protein ACJZ2D_015229 [Fusarium nematophilum]
MATRRLLRISFYSKRSPKLTEAGFRKHWMEVHAPWLTSGWPSTESFNTNRYCPLIRAEFWTTDIQNLNCAFKDPYYLENVYLDEQELFDFASNRWNVGWEELYVKDGKPVSPQTSQETPT